MSTLNELAAEIHGISKAKGFWPPEPQRLLKRELRRNPGEVLMLVVTEAAEAMEAVRDNKWEATYSWHSGPETRGPEMKTEIGRIFFKRVDLELNTTWVEATPAHLKAWGYIPKPEGVPSELADIIIRVLDACAAWEIDIDAAVRAKVVYNATREQLHGRQS